MPLITIKVFEDELSNSQAKDLIHKVTEAVIPFVGEKFRDYGLEWYEFYLQDSWRVKPEKKTLQNPTHLNRMTPNANRTATAT